MLNQQKKVHAEIKRRGVVSTRDSSFVKWFLENAFAGKEQLAKTRLLSVMSDLASKGYLAKREIRNGKDWHNEYFIRG